jgi:putative hydrolase of HD superfamily
MPPSPAGDVSADAAAARRLVDFLAFAEALKRELRHSWLSDGRRESVAEHTWAMGLMALIAAPHLERPVDLAHVLKMILVHDLVEAAAGDVPVFETGARKRLKAERERAAIEEIRTRLGDPVGAEVHALWYEFEDRTTDEARLAVAIDNLEVQLQHNLAPIETWEPVEIDLVWTKMDAPCGHDRFLRALAGVIRADAEAKLAAAGHDVAAAKARLGVAEAG